MSEINNAKWQIDSIRLIIFCNKRIEFPKIELSKEITGQNKVISLNPSLNSDDKHLENRYVEFVPLNKNSNQQFIFTYIEEKNIFDFKLIFEEDKSVYSFLEIKNNFEKFYKSLEKTFTYFNNSVIRIGKVIELSFPVENNIQGCQHIKNSLNFLNHLEGNLDEINLKLNKTYKHKGIEINRVIKIANGQKIAFDIDSQHPKADVIKSVLFNIDINTDSSNKNVLNLESFNNSINKALYNIVNNGGIYND
ncbi:hypothetical protein MJ046_04715 [Acinetobacter bereziniae]|uniref:hypothetical protein n=2 Tax=Acinetobacter bereziniae TaxID=106648 RepID=UPI0022EB1D06|nr:hypothetical protein [Acinetobacter bereziniae]MDA3439639.1 hypothetical protein [Acinetobacter bereziniae]